MAEELPGLAELLHRADPAELLAEVERRCARRDWEGLVVLRDRCNEAAETLGKQLWPIAHYAEYRLALEAPGPWAAAVLLPGAARFALGPLTEVAASTHRWEELAPHLGAPYVAATVAQERVLRGEDLRGDARARGEELELPLVLQPWEPAYALPEYRVDELLENGPPPPAAGAEEVDAAPAAPADLPGIERALHDLVAHWVAQSNGACHVALVHGDAAGAVAAVVPTSFRLTPLTVAEALDRLAWSAASGGAHGRRRGMAAGRSAALWVAHVVTGSAFPAPADALGEALATLGWYAFDYGGAPSGWRLQVAVEDARTGWAAAVDASDLREDRVDTPRG